MSINKAAIAATLGVWIATVGSAAALTYNLNRGPHESGATGPTSSPAPQAAVAAIQPAAPVQSVLYIPTITIVGHVPRPAAQLPRAAAAVTAADISTMRCAGWRELDVGSGRVQTCE
jgi:hypothetical protein